MLYSPHLGEIRPLMDQLCHRWPQLHSRAQRAEQILLDGAIAWHGHHWIIRSQKDGSPYIQNNGACTCPDYANGAPAIEGKSFCKHRIAITAYLWILRDHLRCHAYRFANSESFPFLFDAGGAPICRVAIAQDGRWCFADTVSGYDFSQWLYRQTALEITSFFTQTNLDQSIITA